MTEPDGWEGDETAERLRWEADRLLWEDQVSYNEWLDRYAKELELICPLE